MLQNHAESKDVTDRRILCHGLYGLCYSVRMVNYGILSRLQGLAPLIMNSLPMQACTLAHESQAHVHNLHTLYAGPIYLDFVPTVLQCQMAPVSVCLLLVRVVCRQQQ